jgi:hypothetical protein
MKKSKKDRKLSAALSPEPKTFCLCTGSTLCISGHDAVRAWADRGMAGIRRIETDPEYRDQRAKFIF